MRLVPGTPSRRRGPFPRRDAEDVQGEVHLAGGAPRVVASSVKSATTTSGEY